MILLFTKTLSTGNGPRILDFLGKRVISSRWLWVANFSCPEKAVAGQGFRFSTRSAESLPQYLDSKIVLCDCRVGSS